MNRLVGIVSVAQVTPKALAVVNAAVAAPLADSSFAPPVPIAVHPPGRVKLAAIAGEYLPTSNRIGSLHTLLTGLFIAYDFDKGLLREIIRIKKELNTPNLKFDILDNKILEFSYVYGELFPMKSYYISYDYYNDIFNKKKTTISEFSNKQQKSILKYFKLI